MTYPHAFKSRDDVVKHLAGDAHGWDDPVNEDTFARVTFSQTKDMDGRWFISTAEYLAIHRELHLAEPQMIFSDEQGKDRRQW